MSEPLDELSFLESTYAKQARRAREDFIDNGSVPSGTHEYTPAINNPGIGDVILFIAGLRDQRAEREKRGTVQKAQLAVSRNGWAVLRFCIVSCALAA